MKLDVNAYRVKRNFKLSKIDSQDTGPFNDDDAGKAEAKGLLAQQKEKLAELQNVLYADGSKSLLVVLQALDAGGKDGCIRSVFTGMNPQGVRVASFKAPTEDELAHDFLWRIHKEVPRKGMVAVFNRSHYEDVLIVRVKNLVPKNVWSKRYDLINAFETGLSEAGTQIVKIYLHISKDEQKQRLQERIQNPEKNWKFNPGDLPEREHWKAYMKAFGNVFERCSSSTAPWYVVPGNNKWYRDVIVAQIVLETLQGLKLKYPVANYDPSTVKVI